jgi:hypothetical protein
MNVVEHMLRSSFVREAAAREGHLRVAKLHFLLSLSRTLWSCLQAICLVRSQVVRRCLLPGMLISKHESDFNEAKLNSFCCLRTCHDKPKHSTAFRKSDNDELFSEAPLEGTTCFKF